jgi:hypothetical protein
MIDFIRNPAHPRFYGDRNDRMPLYGERHILDDRQIGMIVDWLRGDEAHATESSTAPSTSGVPPSTARAETQASQATAPATLPAQTRPAETRPAETRPAETRPIETKVEPKPEMKPPGATQPAPKPNDREALESEFD